MPARQSKSRAEGQTTKLVFSATISDVKQKMSSTNSYNGGGMPSGGETSITLKVKMPEAPRLPGIPWEFADGNQYGGSVQTWKPRPELPTPPKAKAARKPKAGEEPEPVADPADDPKFKQKYAETKAKQDAYDRARATWDKGMAAHERATAGFRERVMAYAVLPGLAGVFGGMVLDVVLTPADQTFLPGFGLLMRPEQADDRKQLTEAQDDLEGTVTGFGDYADQVDEGGEDGEEE